MKNEKELFDSYMSYNLVNGETNPYGRGRNSSSGSCPLWLKIIAAVLVVYGIVTLIGIFSSPKCEEPGCNNEPAADSRYCSFHKYKYSYSSSRSSTTTKTTTAPKVTTAPKQTTKKKTTTKKKVTTYKKDDPYDVYDYDDPEDFYYDNYDDFFDYEDAEDYYYDNRY